MKKNKIRHKAICFLLCLIVSMSCFSVTAFARTLIDTDTDTSLTIEYPCDGALFRLYHVADVSKYGEFVISEDFKDYPVSINQPDQSGWRALASTLGGYVSRDKIHPVQSGKISNGKLVFSNLKAGLYLAVGEKHTDDNYRYISDPFIISLPDLDSDENWIYNQSAAPKYIKEPLIETTEISVVKMWKDSSDKSKRPDSVTIQLLQNGNVFDTVTLNEQNNWKFAWQNLDNSYTWQLTEDNVPKGYTVTVQSDDKTFVVTNSLKSTTPTPSNNNRLPQTGVLWWPVGIFAAAGVILLCLGIARRKRTYGK